MSKLLVTKSLLDDLADAVSEKSGVSIPMTIEEMTDAVESISAGGDYTHIASAEYTVSTSSTTAIDVATMQTGDTSIWTSAKMVFIKIRDKAGRRNGYFFGTDSIVCNSGPGNNLTATSTMLIYGTTYYQGSNGNLVNFNLQRASSGVVVQGYGVYPIRLYSDGSIDFSARYNASNSLTIDGTFKVDVYLLNFPNGVNPFDE